MSRPGDRPLKPLSLEPPLETKGRVKKGTSKTSRGLSRNFDPRKPNLQSYLEAINRAFHEYYASHGLQMEAGRGTESQATVGPPTPDTALEFLDAGVKNVRAMGAERRRRRKSLEALRIRGALRPGTADGGQGYTVGQGHERLYPEVPQPQNIWLEFAPKKGDRDAIGFGWSETCNYPQYAKMKNGDRKLNAPGWLTNLSPTQIRAVHEIKDYLSSFRKRDDFTQAIDDMHPHLIQLGVIGITKPEITKALRFCPDDKNGGLDYRAFLLAAGDFGYAAVRSAIRPYPRKIKIREDQDDAELYKGSEFDAEVKKIFEDDKNAYDNESSQAGLKKNQSQRSAGVSDDPYYEQYKEQKRKEAEEQRAKEVRKQELIDTKQQMTKKYISEGMLPLTAANRAGKYLKRMESEAAEEIHSKDANSYSARQKAAWTGLFLGEMYDAMDMIQKLATSRSAVIPHKVAPWDEHLYKQWRLDRLERAATAPSPYLQPLAFVNSRIEKEFPKSCPQTNKKCRGRGVTKVKYDHWILDLPPAGEGRVVVTENRYRIRQILDYVFFKSGSALCVLPHVDLMLHFAKNLTEQILGRTSTDEGASGDGTDKCHKGKIRGRCRRSVDDVPLLLPEDEEEEAYNTPGSSPVLSKHSLPIDVGTDETGGSQPRRTSDGSQNSTNTITTGDSPTNIPIDSFVPATISDESQVSSRASYEDGLIPISSPIPSKVPEEQKKREAPPPSTPPPMPNLCTAKFTPHDLPAKFKNHENQWIRKYTNSLFPTPNITSSRPKEPTLPFRDFEPLRQKMAKFHRKEWKGYSCRRLQFRQELRDKLTDRDFNSKLQRDRFSETFGTLLPLDTRQPRSILKTNVEYSLNRY